MSPEASTIPDSRRRELTTWLIGTAVAVAVLLGAVVAMGGRIEAATWGLVVAAGAMVWALRALYSMALALSRPPLESTLEQEDVAASAGLRELREERRRVLRAINELQFDYQMGKLSEDDYRTVREGYELRAVEVMRALEAEKSLHPELQQELRRRGLLDEVLDAERDEAAKSVGEAAGEEAAESADEDASDEAAKAADEAAKSDDEDADDEAAKSADEDASDEAAKAAPKAAATVTCAACEGTNDPDAKFCKHCGGKLGVEEARA